MIGAGQFQSNEPSPPTVVSVVLADEQSLFRAGVRALMADLDDIRLIGEASDGREAIQVVAGLQPDVLILNASLPGLRPSLVAQAVGRESPATRVIGLTNAGISTRSRQVGVTGSQGFLGKRCRTEHLLQAIHTVAEGGTFVCPASANCDAREPSQIDKLSGREREVMAFLADGASVAQVADQLFISEKTVESHRAKIKSKLKLQSLVDLTKLAVREGLTEL